MTPDAKYVIQVSALAGISSIPCAPQRGSVSGHRLVYDHLDYYIQPDDRSRHLLSSALSYQLLKPTLISDADSFLTNVFRCLGAK